jgi:hypothetical protein
MRIYKLDMTQFRGMVVVKQMEVLVCTPLTWHIQTHHHCSTQAKFPSYSTAHPAPPPLDCGPCSASRTPRCEPQTPYLARHATSLTLSACSRRIQPLYKMSDLETVSSFVEGAPPGEVRPRVIGFCGASSANQIYSSPTLSQVSVDQDAVA